MVLVLSTTLSVSKCSRIKFDPDAYKANSSLESIINEAGVEVMCHEAAFDSFACMHKDKWIELRELIQDARIDKGLKLRLLNKLNKVVK